MSVTESYKTTGNYCIHCGDECRDDTIEKNGNYFCCSGCLFVYELLNDTEIQKNYDLSSLASISPKKVKDGEYDFLDDPETASKLIQYSINGKAKVILSLPAIYCSACVWLLENISRIDPGIIEARINFLRKEASITYIEDKTSLKKIASLLASIGYKPRLNLSSIESGKIRENNRSLMIKLGIAGFCFANIMLFALPEYLSFGTLESGISTYLRYLSLIASVPVMYSATDYYRGAWTGLKMKIISIDLPLSLGIIILFVRSAYEIISGTGPGFSDSLSGLVFFLLLGKVFQKKTFHDLSFDRDYKSYFPLSVIRKNGSKEEYIPVKDIKIGNILVIRNSEIVPADAILESQQAAMDYSFVTGESTPVIVKHGDKIYSGAKHTGQSIEVRVIKNFRQSYMTELWNTQISETAAKSYTSEISNKVAKYFSIGVLAVALAGFIFWLPTDSAKSWQALISVLIVACPCALSLSNPFSYGTALRVFSKNKFYLKNDKVVEYLTRANRIIFDKTGTLTEPDKSEVDYTGRELTPDEMIFVRSVVKNSTHPYSRIIYNLLKCEDSLKLDTFFEEAGKGLEASKGSTTVRIGNSKWIAGDSNFQITEDPFSADSSVNIAFNGRLAGSYSIKSRYRDKIFDTFKDLDSNYELEILSGDSPAEKSLLELNLPRSVSCLFEQKPYDKLNRIKFLRSSGKKIIMVGDGLNDAGALLQSDVGIAVTDNTANFTPGADAIIQSDSLPKLPAFLQLAGKAVRTVYLSYSLSFAYNIVGFGFALTGRLSPVVAAILMPLSSISVVLLTVLKVSLNAKKLHLQ